MYSDVTGIILAGGKSSRMGTNKALLSLNGQTVIERVAALMKSVFTKVILITNTREELGFIDLRMYKDIY